MNQRSPREGLTRTPRICEGSKDFDPRRRKVRGEERAIGCERRDAEQYRKGEASRRKRNLRTERNLGGENDEQAQHRRGNRIERLHHEGERKQRRKKKWPIACRPPGDDDAHEHIEPGETERQRESVRPKRAARAGGDQPGAKPCRERHRKRPRNHATRRRIEKYDRQSRKRRGENSLIEGVAILVESDAVINGRSERGRQHGNWRAQEARPIGIERQQRIGRVGNARGGARDKARDFPQDIEIGAAPFAERTYAGLSCRCNDVRSKVRRRDKEIVVVDERLVGVGFDQPPSYRGCRFSRRRPICPGRSGYR